MAIFFGKVGKGGSMGFFARRGDGRPKLLVLGVKQSSYRKPYLKPALDQSMIRAGERVGEFKTARLRRALEDGAI